MKDGIEYATQILEAHDAESRKTVSNKNNGIVAEAEGSIVKLFQDSTAGKLLQTLPHNHDVSRIVFSPDGNYLATASDHDSGRIWDVQSGQEVSRLTHDNPNVVDVDFSPDGRFIATASWDHTARIWLWQPDDLILQAGSRVSRNLTLEEWQRYLLNEPYRETFPEFGSSSLSAESSEKNNQEVSDE